MKQLNERHLFTGMQRDTTAIMQPTSFLYNARNIRLTPREGNTLYAITNEKGTQETGISISGTYLGHCLLNEFLVIFSSTVTGDKPDYITRINLENNKKDVLYNGKLEFDINFPIDAISSYENKKIQKVYWTDGKNQPRVINIADIDNILQDVDSQFDFVPELSLQEEVTVTKLLGQGQFPPGVIQYALTYFNKYRQESNIFYVTPLQSISYKERGGSPEDKIANAFKISIANFDKNNFEYLRIYSILRTSLNATPIVKKVQDLPILKSQSNDPIVFIDDGTMGEAIDPTELLYKGGETIKAKTLEQKDGTLFLGNIELEEKVSTDTISTFINEAFNPKETNIETTTDNSKASLKTIISEVDGDLISKEDIPYTNSINISGFKNREVYRIGIQFQTKTGRWSEPFWIRDYKIQTSDGPSIDNETGKLNIPEIEVQLKDSNFLDGINNEYKRARLLMAQPTNNDRLILCQGIANPILYSKAKRYVMNTDGVPDEENEGPLYGQSSWLFRPKYSETQRDSTAKDGGGYISSYNDYTVHDTYYMKGVFIEGEGGYASPYLRSTEIGASVEYDGFWIDQKMITIHSPELVFDDSLYSQDWTGVEINRVGITIFDTTFGDIDIQTKSATIGSAQGFIHKSIKTVGNAALVSGLFYEDYIVDDNGSLYQRYRDMHYPVSWPIYLWHKSSSLNNDVPREGRSAELLKKIISNYHVSNNNSDTNPVSYTPNDIQLFKDDEVSIIKVNGHSYMGNIDTVVVPNIPEHKYFVGNPLRTEKDTSFLSNSYYRLGLKVPGDESSKNGVWELSFENNALDWRNINVAVGNNVPGLCESSESIRIKYKSTPHLVADLSNTNLFNSLAECSLPLVEITRKYDKNTFYGGQSDEALQANLWIPISEPVSLEGTTITLISDRGDTHYQRFECLKTYPFTTEDINQVVDIASFMVETHINIDGRYDRNRGQFSNLHVSPINFNLYNPVYSQLDNFFNYRILEKDYNTLNTFPNQITWTKEKKAGAETDLWTNITLASTYDIDGSKGEIVSLNTWKNQLYCFQRKGISNILFNSRVQIPVSDGVPIEISNNYKVDGYNYISDGIGCDNKLLIKETSSGIYFIDAITQHLYHISNDIQDITVTKNMTSWFKNVPNPILKLVHDNVNHDLYLVNEENTLCFSELLGQFISFLDYGNISLLESYSNKVFTMKDGELYQMFVGPYNYFFNDYKPWEFTFICNGIDNGTPDFDKIFTNLDYRMDMLEDNEYKHDNTLDYIQVTNEYQDTGEVDLSRLKVPANPKSYHHKGTNLQKKFRTWRIQIPRNNNSLDRIRNPWCKIRLGSKGFNNLRAVLYDLNVQYFV